MQHLKHNVRIVITALCGFAYLVSLLPMMPVMLVAFLHGEHAAQLVQHDGHQDLRLHQDDADATDDHDAHDQQTHEEEHASHENHHDHLVCLSDSSHAVAMGELGTRVPLASVCVLEWAHEDFIATWTITGEITRARPPPPIPNTVLVCLRTTMLVV